MSSTDQICAPNDFENGWGFYVDLENLHPVLQERGHSKQGEYNSEYNCEYNYEYFAEYYNDFEAEYDDYYNTYTPYPPGTNKNKRENVGAIIARVGSATIITVAALTYVIFFSIL
jgi:hypothetical protein